MKPQKIFLLMMPFILLLQLLLAACALAPGAPAGGAQAPSSGDAAAAAAKPADEMPPPVQGDSRTLIVYGAGDKTDEVVADFPLQKIGEPIDLGFLNKNWIAQLYQITDGSRSDNLAVEISEKAKDVGVDVFAEPNVAIGISINDEEKGLEGEKGRGGSFGSPGDPPLSGPEEGFEKQWAWYAQGINLSSKNPVDGAGIVVAIFDTCPTGQPAWVDVIEPLSNPGSTNQDYLEHGASIASLIDHMAPSAQIELYCILAPDGTGELDDLIQGIAKFSAKHPEGPGGTNLSLGIEEDSSLLQQLLDEAHTRQFVTVAAAGNHSNGQTVQGMNYPAAYDSVIGVAGSNYDRKRAGFSNQGDVAAPAGQERFAGPAPDCEENTQIYVVTRAESSPTGYLCWQGTSFATAFVSGEAALLLSKNPTASAQEIFDHIYGTANDPSESALGKGIINVTKALQ